MLLFYELMTLLCTLYYNNVSRHVVPFEHIIMSPICYIHVVVKKTTNTTLCLWFKPNIWSNSWTSTLEADMLTILQLYCEDMKLWSYEITKLRSPHFYFKVNDSYYFYVIIMYIGIYIMNIMSKLVPAYRKMVTYSCFFL